MLLEGTWPWTDKQYPRHVFADVRHLCAGRVLDECHEVDPGHPHGLAEDTEECAKSQAEHCSYNMRKTWDWRVELE